MRAAAGLHADDALGSERVVADEELRVLLRVDVVGDHRDLVAIAQRLAQGERQRGLAGADGAADADAQRPWLPGGSVHERNNLEYCVS